jgi:hypothetical protein
MVQYDKETQRVRNLSQEDLLDYIDANGTRSPEREHWEFLQHRTIKEFLE